MKLNPQISLVFDGQCEEAFRLYERCMNGRISFIMTWAESPTAAEAPPEWGHKIAHATLEIGNTAMSGSDVVPGRYERPRGFSIVLQTDDPLGAERVFAALAENGVVGMPLQETYWAKRFGSVVDRYGISWAINCE